MGMARQNKARKQAGAQNQEGEEVQLTKMQSVLVGVALFVSGFLVPFLGALELKYQVKIMKKANIMSLVKYIYTFSMSKLMGTPTGNTVAAELKAETVARSITCVWSVLAYGTIVYGLLTIIMAEEPKAEEAGDVEAPAVKIEQK